MRADEYRIFRIMQAGHLVTALLLLVSFRLKHIKMHATAKVLQFMTNFTHMLP